MQSKKDERKIQIIESKFIYVGIVTSTFQIELNLTFALSTRFGVRDIFFWFFVEKYISTLSSLSFRSSDTVCTEMEKCEKALPPKSLLSASDISLGIEHSIVDISYDTATTATKMVP